MTEGKSAPQVDEDLIKAYQVRLGISYNEAKNRLVENFRKEMDGEFDVGQMVLKLVKSFREISPKVVGMEQREHDLLYRIKVLESQVSKQQEINEDLKEHLHKLQRYIENYIRLEEQISYQNHMIEELQQHISTQTNTSFFSRMWNKIKWLLKT